MWLSAIYKNYYNKKSAVKIIPYKRFEKRFKYMTGKKNKYYICKLKNMAR